MDIDVDIDIIEKEKNFADYDRAGNLGIYKGLQRFGKDSQPTTEAKLNGRLKAKQERIDQKKARNLATKIAYEQLVKIQKELKIKDSTISFRDRLAATKFVASLGVGELKTIQLNDQEIMIECMNQTIADIFSPDSVIMDKFGELFKQNLMKLTNGK